METQKMLPGSQSHNLFLHPMHWLKNRYSEAETRRQQIRMPYSVHLPILPSNLHSLWQELSKHRSGAQMKNNVFFYKGDDGSFFTAHFEVNRWQGVFFLASHKIEAILPQLTDMEFWGMALREHANTDNQLPDKAKAHGAVFWQNGTLNVYPAKLGPSFEHYLHEHLLS